MTKLTAHQLAVIIDTLNQSLMTSNWNGYYTAQSRENVRNVIATIMDHMSVEIKTIANVFILSFLYVNEVDFTVYIYITR